MRKKVLLLTVAVLALAVASVSVMAAEWTTTLVYFNIGAVDELTVTLLGQSGTTSSGSGQATAQAIQFNTTQSDDVYVNATVIAAEQDNTNPILTIANTGTTSAQVDIWINETFVTATHCLQLRYVNDTDENGQPDYYPTAGLLENLNDTVNVTLAPALGFGEGPLRIWLFGNFSQCQTSDSTVANLYIHGTFT